MFETERCVVREWHPDEAERALDLSGRWEVARWLGARPQPMETREQADRMVARGALDHGFAAGLAELLAVVRPDNTPSLAVCHRLGMERLGRTSRYCGTELELSRAARP